MSGYYFWFGTKKCPLYAVPFFLVAASLTTINRVFMEVARRYRAVASFKTIVFPAQRRSRRPATGVIAMIHRPVGPDAAIRRTVCVVRRPRCTGQIIGVFPSRRSPVRLCRSLHVAHFPLSFRASVGNRLFTSAPICNRITEIIAWTIPASRIKSESSYTNHVKSIFGVPIGYVPH